MMKRWKLFLILVLASVLIIGAAGTVFAGYRVIGAGTEEANGLYCETDETSFERPVYRKGESEWIIRLRITGTSRVFYVWEIIKEGGELNGQYYGNANDSITLFPPLDGWVTSRTGLALDPAPNLQEDLCGSAEKVPSVSEWGMVILSLILVGSARRFMRKQFRRI